MICPEKLEFRLWKATVGHWGALTARLKRFDKNASDVLSLKTSGLLNHIATQQPGFDITSFIGKTLPVAAERLSAKQYEETLELTARLVDAGLNPNHVLSQGVPVLAQHCTAADSFSTNLGHLEMLVRAMHEKGMDAGKPLMVAVRAAAKVLDARQMATALKFSLRLVEIGKDPTDVLRFGMPATATALSAQQFRLAMSLASHASRRGLCLTDLLGTQLPTVAREVSPDELTAGLQMCLQLEEQDAALKDFFRTGLPSIVEISPTNEEFFSHLKLVSQMVLVHKKAGIDIDPPLTAMTSGLEATDDFSTNVDALCDFSLLMKKQGVAPNTLLKHGLPMAIPHTPESFRATLRNLATVVVRLRGAKVNDHFLSFIIECGLDRVAKISQTPEQYRNNLLALMKSFRPLVLKRIDPACHERALATIHESPDSYVNVVDELSSQAQLTGGLACLYELAACPAFDWRRLALKRVIELAEQMVEALTTGKSVTLEFDNKRGPQLVPLEPQKATAILRRQKMARVKAPSSLN